MDDPISKDLDYPSLSEAVRHYSAERFYDMITKLQPFMDGLYDSDPSALAYMEPARIAAHTQIAKLQVSVVRELGSLYRVAQEPKEPEPEEPMIPAAQVPLMIEAAVNTAVELAVEEVRMELEAQKAEQARISSDQARSTLVEALNRIRSRSDR